MSNSSERLAKEVPRIATAALGAFAMHKHLTSRRKQRQNQERLSTVQAQAQAAQRQARMRGNYIQELYQESQVSQRQISRLEHEAKRDRKFPVFGNTEAYKDLFKNLKDAHGTGHHRADDPADEVLRHSHALILIDLDKFKEYNDTFGHGKGDQALETIGELLTTNVRENDLVFRQGGDELGVVLRHTNLESAASTAEGLRIGIQDLGLGNITASMGMVMIDLDETPEKNMEFADSALYAVKESGRNSLAIYDPSLRAPRMAA